MSSAGTRGGGSRFLYEPFGQHTDQEQLEYRDLLRSLGTPEQIKEKIEEIDQLIQDKQRRDWLFSSIRTIAGWAAVVAAGWLALKGLLTEFLVSIPT